MSYFDVSDAEGVELEERWDDVTSVDECVHGEHPIECALCTSAGTIAAVSGEGGDMAEEHTRLDDNVGFIHPLHTYHPLALVTMRNAIDAELKHRRESLKKQLDATEHALNGTQPRKTRKDAGTTRPRKEQAA